MEKIYIKNMVCQRCVKVVEQILGEQALPYEQVLQGEVQLSRSLTAEETASLRQALEHEGFQLLDNERARLIEKVKNTIIRLVHQQERFFLPVKLSVLLEEEIGADYSYLSRLFSETESTTIEKYLIAQRIERAKELLAYGELNLNEIADTLGYSSTAHLSAQFKKITGMPPSRFKKMGREMRKPLDEI